MISVNIFLHSNLRNHQMIHRNHRMMIYRHHDQLILHWIHRNWSLRNHRKNLHILHHRKNLHILHHRELLHQFVFALHEQQLSGSLLGLVGSLEWSFCRA